MGFGCSGQEEIVVVEAATWELPRPATTCLVYCLLFDESLEIIVALNKSDYTAECAVW